MKNIHFDNYNKQYYFVVLFVIVILLVLYFIFRETKYAHFFYAASTLISVVFILKNTWHKAYVQFTSSRIFIRLNRKSGVSLSYESITSIERTENELIIIENKKSHHFLIQDVNPKDVKRLIDILMKFSEAHYKDDTELAYYK